MKATKMKKTESLADVSFDKLVEELLVRLGEDPAARRPAADPGYAWNVRWNF